jgi:CYTH domain-containing protein
MKTERQFLIARSLARLIQKERGVTARAVEGYISSDPEKIHFVSIDAEQCHLVLLSKAQGGAGAVEERTEVSRPQAESLLNVCVGKVAYDRTRLPLGGNREAVVDRFVAPGQFDLVTVEFESANEASSFFPPAWFGPEVTGEAAYGKRTLALNGAVQPRDVALSNAALDSLLDLIENRFSLARFGSSAARQRAEARPGEAPPRPAAVQPDRPVPPRTREAAPAPSESASVDRVPSQPVRAPAQAQTHGQLQAHGQVHGQSQAQALAHALEPAAADTDPQESPQPAADDSGRFDDVLATLSRALVDPGFLGKDAAAPRPVAVELDRSARRVRRE